MIPKRILENTAIGQIGGGFVGLYAMEKNFGLLGSEGLIRFHASDGEVDLHAACPMRNDNRMNLSANYSYQTLEDANGELYRTGERKENTASTTKMSLTARVSDNRNSPAYGIAVFKKKES